MKLTYRFVMVTAILLAVLGQLSLRAGSMAITFPTSGNCYLCQVRIEGAVNALAGIEDVSWDYSTEITTVTYDDAQSDAFIIMNAIANVGHDTEWFPAPDSAYNLLIGTCCEYERTIDYTDVEVGYLSLMGIWIYHVGVLESEKNERITVFPSAGTGLYTYNFESQFPIPNCTFIIISLAGEEVFRVNVNDTKQGKLNLTHLAKGQYILIASDSGNMLAWTKLIKL